MSKAAVLGALILAAGGSFVLGLLAAFLVASW